jgi:hypothetical protein
VARVAEGPGAEMRLGGRSQADRCGGAGATLSPCEGDDDSLCFNYPPGQPIFTQ